MAVPAYTLREELSEGWGIYELGQNHEEKAAMQRSGKEVQRPKSGRGLASSE